MGRDPLVHHDLDDKDAPPPMFPFWDSTIAPIMQAVGARRIVEIGALRGDTTKFMLEELGPDVELHVIDPVPAFDPSEHERAFPGRYRFHRDLSHNVLPDLAAVDVALVDGDHNWYTVYHELRLLAEASRREGQPLPVIILHDVGWPYGRRDLYYAPEQIPEEFRQQHHQAGMVKGKPRLVFKGGLNPTMHNAMWEGGERNGVMTAIDDFVDEHPDPIRRVHIPIYFGLEILVTEERLASSPELASILDHIESPAGREEQLYLGEDLRLRAMVMQHNIFYNAEARHRRAAERYLDLLKGCLVNEHYLEHELRIDHLTSSFMGKGAPSDAHLRDPIRQMKAKYARHLAARRSGTVNDDLPGYFPYTSMGRERLDLLQRCMDTIHAESVDGDIVDAGCGRGGAGLFLRGYLAAFDMNVPTTWIVDRFRATDDSVETDQEEKRWGGPGLPALQADLNNVRDAFARFDLFGDRVRFLQGPAADTLPEAPIDKVALLHIGRQSEPEDVTATLEQLYAKLAVGGFVVVEQYGDEAIASAVDDFRSRWSVPDEIERIGAQGCRWRKTEAIKPPDTTTARSADAGSLPRRAPLAPPAPATAKDLSVVVVFYNMARVATRTLHSLSRSYQVGIEGLDYEVLVVDNGSAPEQKLTEEFVTSFGPEFRLIDMGDDAHPSPVHALNRGMQEATGENLAFMIDGAHVVTPGVLRFGMLGMSTYEPAVVVTQQWYVGPGQQGDMMLEGYDEEFEDRLFDTISWPSDGYRLFDIGHFIGERDWLDGLWESNCIFLPRKLLEQVGGFDESFDMAGGGFANLELYERMTSSPDTTVVTMLGEGSFHQIHGGTTTNLPSIDERHGRLASYAHHYQDLRGRNYIGHRKRLHYVGTMFDEANRTRARRRTAPNFFKKGAKSGPDGRPTKPAPLPSELRQEFVDAYWHSLAWRDTEWLGRKVGKLPTDLFAYQEIVAKVRPDWIIETGTGGGGRALFLASICYLLGHGEVLSIDRNHGDKLPQHPRLRYLTVKDTWSKETEAEVNAIVGENANAVVILGSRGSAKRTVAEFRVYSHHVPVGSYVIVEDTIVNGHPVWTDFGPGPYEGVKGIVEGRGSFASDLDMEKYRLSFNPGGFLRRMS
ncbi:MAG: class I SAM-dependent methyltransferase [Acidimicrobiia bacterium]|nr:class I SAM-dependent methyltransferase [Acidimicrobiia bacterium]